MRFWIQGNYENTERPSRANLPGFWEEYGKKSWAGQIAVHANACWCSDRHAAKRGKGLK